MDVVNRGVGHKTVKHMVQHTQKILTHLSLVDGEDLERSGQQTSLNGQDWSTTKQSDRHNTAKNGGQLHPTLGKRTEHDDDDDESCCL